MATQFQNDLGATVARNAQDRRGIEFPCNYVHFPPCPLDTNQLLPVSTRELYWNTWTIVELSILYCGRIETRRKSLNVMWRKTSTLDIARRYDREACSRVSHVRIYTCYLVRNNAFLKPRSSLVQVNPLKLVKNHVNNIREVGSPQ